MAIDKNLLDRSLAGRDPGELFARDGLLDALKKALSEWILAAELDDHLESKSAEGAINRRNGTSKVTLDVSRHRAGTFDPKLIASTSAASQTNLDSFCRTSTRAQAARPPWRSRACRRQG